MGDPKPSNDGPPAPPRPAPPPTNQPPPPPGVLLLGVGGGVFGVVLGGAGPPPVERQPLMVFLFTGWMVGCLLGGTIGHYVATNPAWKRRVIQTFIVVGALAKATTYYVENYTVFGPLDRGDRAFIHGDYSGAIAGYDD